MRDIEAILEEVHTNELAGNKSNLQVATGEYYIPSWINTDVKDIKEDDKKRYYGQHGEFPSRLCTVFGDEVFHLDLRKVPLYIELYNSFDRIFGAGWNCYFEDKHTEEACKLLFDLLKSGGIIRLELYEYAKRDGYRCHFRGFKGIWRMLDRVGFADIKEVGLYDTIYGFEDVVSYFRKVRGNGYKKQKLIKYILEQNGSLDKRFSKLLKLKEGEYERVSRIVIEAKK